MRTTIPPQFILAALLALATPPLVAADGTRFSWERGLEVRRGDWQVELGGRVHLDAATFDDDVTPLDDDLTWRRVRPRIDVRFGSNWQLRADYDFGNVADGWKNAWVGYRISRGLEVRVGNQTVPFGLEEAMSSDDLPLMERPLATQLAPGLLTGVMLRGDGGAFGYSLGVFANDLSDDDRRKIDGTSVAGRVNWAPVRGRDGVLHFGLSAEYRDADSGEAARYRARPESSVTDVRLIDTGSIAAVDHVLTVGTEMAWASGPVRLQAEYLAADVSQATGSDPRFSGWYAGASWVLTGEQRRYSRRAGAFGELKPRGRFGAVELAARYGSLDLQDGTATGGEQQSLALGVNWYLNRNCRLMVDFVDADAAPNRNGVDESPSLWQARVQLGF